MPPEFKNLYIFSFP